MQIVNISSQVVEHLTASQHKNASHHLEYSISHLNLWACVCLCVSWVILHFSFSATSFHTNRLLGQFWIIIPSQHIKDNSLLQ